MSAVEDMTVDTEGAERPLLVDRRTVWRAASSPRKSFRATAAPSTYGSSRIGERIQHNDGLGGLRARRGLHRGDPAGSVRPPAERGAPCRGEL